MGIRRSHRDDLDIFYAKNVAPIYEARIGISSLDVDKHLPHVFRKNQPVLQQAGQIEMSKNLHRIHPGRHTRWFANGDPARRREVFEPLYSFCPGRRNEDDRVSRQDKPARRIDESGRFQLIHLSGGCRDEDVDWCTMDDLLFQ